MRRTVVAAVAALLWWSAPAFADSVEPGREIPVPGQMLEQPPEVGMFYERYEPTFYTGFAPRPVDPARVHLHMGRGNQLRVTVVLSDQVLESYARDLQVRRDTYRRLVDDGRVVLTQNEGFAAFEARLAAEGLDEWVAAEQGLSPAQRRARNLELLERLNPGRVYRLSMPLRELARRWVARLRPADRKAMDRDRALEVLNALLPTRLWVAEMGAGTRRDLQALVKSAPAGEPTPEFEKRYVALLDRVAPGRYPRRGEALAFVEFTAIYPIGTFNDYTDYRGRKIPLYPTPGLRALTTHQRTKTADHIPTIPIYSYSPWLPYMHVGTTMHNSFHTIWWRMEVDHTSFLPASWRHAPARNGKDGGRPDPYLWLLSRGPMSHGCTHLTTGHINELRQLLPAETKKLYDVDVFLNRSYDYDVFDIDGDFEPEVMGVEYYIAYSLRNKRPNQLRVRNERGAYYDWLYAGDLDLDAGDRGVFSDVYSGRFVERTAKRGAHFDRVRLHEAPYEPEHIQFYRLVDIPFARELRKVGASHPFDGSALR